MAEGTIRAGGPDGAARFGQLTYGQVPASASGTAGWRVFERSQELDDARAAVLVRLAVTNLDAHVEVPAVGSGLDAFRALPVRFGYRLCEDGSGAYWHATAVDEDSKRRSGNVFTHALADADPTAAIPPLRPIELWRSAGWRAPYWFTRITEAPFGGPPEPGPDAEVSRLIEFLFDPAHYRVGFLAVLADAVADALDGGPVVVLQAGDQDEAALWIALVSRLLSPRTARRLAFSLYERAAGAAAAAKAISPLDDVPGFGALHVVVVPREDAVARIEGGIVLRTWEDVSTGVAGGAHTTASGDEIPVGALSQFVQYTLYDPGIARAVFDAIDAVCARTGDPDVGNVAWPFAMAIALDPDAFAGAAEIAAPVVLEATPVSAVGDPELSAAVSRLIGALPPSGAAELHARLVTMSPERSYAYRFLAEGYATAALADEEWLARQGAMPTVAPIAGEVAPAAVERVRSLLRARLAESEGHAEDPAADPAVVALRALRSVEVVSSLGLTTRDAETRERAEELVTVALSLLERAPAHAAVVFAAIGSGTRERLIVPVARGHVGSALSETATSFPADAVTALLADVALDPVADLSRITAEPSFERDLVLLGAVDADAPRVRMAAALIVQFDSTRLPADAREFLRGAARSFDDLDRVRELVGGRALPPIMVATVLASRPGGLPALERLQRELGADAEAASARGNTGHAAQLAQLIRARIEAQTRIERPRHWNADTEHAVLVDLLGLSAPGAGIPKGLGARLAPELVGAAVTSLALITSCYSRFSNRTGADDTSVLDLERLIECQRATRDVDAVLAHLGAHASGSDPDPFRHHAVGSAPWSFVERAAALAAVTADRRGAVHVPEFVRQTVSARTADAAGHTGPRLLDLFVGRADEQIPTAAHPGGAAYGAPTGNPFEDDLFGEPPARAPRPAAPADGNPERARGSAGAISRPRVTAYVQEKYLPDADEAARIVETYWRETHGAAAHHSPGGDPRPGQRFGDIVGRVGQMFRGREKGQ